MDESAENAFSVKRWILATFSGWVIGVILILMLSGILDSIGIEGMQFYLGLGMGTGVGIAQWLIFRKFAAINVTWMLASSLGMGIPFIIIDLLPVIILYKLPISVAVSAFTVGLLQFFLLKKYFTKSYLWIFGSFFGWTLGVAIVFTINYMMMIKVTGYMNLVMALINLLLILAGGIVLGIVSGITFKKIIE